MCMYMDIRRSSVSRLRGCRFGAIHFQKSHLLKSCAPPEHPFQKWYFIEGMLRVSRRINVEIQTVWEDICRFTLALRGTQLQKRDWLTSSFRRLLFGYPFWNPLKNVDSFPINVDDNLDPPLGQHCQMHNDSPLLGEPILSIFKIPASRVVAAVAQALAHMISRNTTFPEPHSPIINLETAQQRWNI